MMRVSVILPTLNEAATIKSALGRLRLQACEEVIVVDASSPDGTAERAREQGAFVIESPRGRGVQQNIGASRAGGDILVFLHADCWLEPGSLAGLRSFLARHPRVPGGCFRMRVEAEQLLYRGIDASAHLRAGVFGIPYGDQGIFVRRRAFEHVGGFPEVPLLEDIGISLKLRRLGRLAVLPYRIYVSARRWRRYGIVGQSVRNWSLTAAAALGIPPETLARFYPHTR
jgi:rSAM/selenodomain-associated transferase 2